VQLLFGDAAKELNAATSCYWNICAFTVVYAG